MSNDIHNILERLNAIEGKLTPTGEKKGLNPQQKDAKQLPALFKPKSITALGSKTDPKHPMDGMAVGACESAEPRSALEEAMVEIEEDMLSKVKRDLTTYLDKLEKKVAVDRELKDKAVAAVEKGQAEEDDAVEQEPVAEDPTESEPAATPPQTPVMDPVLPEGAPVKTFEMDNGECLECWGDQERGFEIRRQGRALPTRFQDLDHAQMAVDLYKARRNKQQTQPDQDYIEER